MVEGVLEHLVLPAPEGRHVAAGGAAGGELDASDRSSASSSPLPSRPGRIAVAVLYSICQGPSISLPRHQNLTSCGFSQPCARRRSDQSVPPGWLQYSTRLRAASPARVPRLTASIGSTPAARHQSMNSLVPNAFGSVVNQARSSLRGALLDRADAVLPIVAGDEVAAGIAHDRRAELLDEGEHVAAEALRVGGRMAGLVDAAIDATAEMLDEGAEQAGVGVGRSRSRDRTALSLLSSICLRPSDGVRIGSVKAARPRRRPGRGRRRCSCARIGVLRRGEHGTGLAAFDHHALLHDDEAVADRSRRWRGRA